MIKVFKKAFTLAEVLITLGIIGVVAAMTMPSLIAKYQKEVWANQLKANYSLIYQGIQRYMADEGISDLTDTYAKWENDTTAFYEFFDKYFKIAKNCEGSYLPCWSDETTTLDNSWSGFHHNYSCQITLSLVNGAAICADIYAGTGHLLNFEIDINGPKGPNKSGYDGFGFRVDRNGKIFDFGEWDGKGNGALTRVMEDGWKINY